MSELSFLLDLLLNEKLPKTAKDKVLARVKEVETACVAVVPLRPVAQVSRVINGAVQSASTAAALARQEAMVVSPEPAQAQEGAPPVIVASPAAAQAINSRNQAINEAINAVHGKGVPGRASPRKF